MRRAGKLAPPPGWPVVTEGGVVFEVCGSEACGSEACERMLGL
jgi:hypothetical protein